VYEIWHYSLTVIFKGVYVAELSILIGYD